MKKAITKKAMPKAQLGKIVKAIDKAADMFKAVDKVSDAKKVGKIRQIGISKPGVPGLSPSQKKALAEGKDIHRGSGRLGNATVDEMRAKKDLEKAIQQRTNPKKLTKKEQYLKDVEDLYRKKGGAIKTKKK
jgi:hypothetical protein